MANLLLLKDLLPDVYKVMGTPSKVLVIAPFKTPFGYLEAVVEDAGKNYVIYNTDIPYNFLLLGFQNLSKRFKSFTILPVQIDTDSQDPRIVVELKKENNNTDLIKLAKVVDEFMKDLNDFVRKIIQFEEVRRKLGAVNSLLFKFSELKEKQKQKLKEEADKTKYEIIDLYNQIRALVIDAESQLKRQNYEDTERLINQAFKLMNTFDALREKYKRLTGRSFYDFQAEVLKKTLSELREKIESE